MKYRTRSIILWILSFVLMGGAGVYQRLTGPTHPVRGKVEMAGETIKYKLIRTWEGTTDAEVAVEVEDRTISGTYKFRRFKSFDDWSEKPLERQGNELIARLPNQPPAGKVEYQILLGENGNFQSLEEKPLILRYKGVVPAFVIIPHIIIIFLAMMFSMRAGFEAFIHGRYLVKQTLWTLILLTVGGMILGPIVQKFAFDAYWTGWPFGTDLTDNKTAVAFIMWVVAYLKVRKNPNQRGWVMAAAIILLAVYMIPHSMLGSEIDYTQETINN